MKTSNYSHKSYDGGHNDSVSAQELERNEGNPVQNWCIQTKGKLTRRKGLTPIGNTLTGVAEGLHAYLRADGGKDLLVMDDGSLKYLNGTSFTTLDSGFTKGNLFWMENCPINNKVYISNEDNTTHSWDRAGTVLNACLNDYGTTKYQANVLRWHKNHMFFLNNLKAGGIVYKNSIGWSAMNDPETHDTVNDIIEIPGNGRVITAIDQGNVLVIFKERSIQFLSGWGDTSWQITASASNVANLSEQVGCIAPRGATRVGNEIWFIDDEANIRKIYQTDFDAYRNDIISTKLKTTIAGFNIAQLSKAVAWTNGDHVYFAVPDGSSTVNSIVLAFDILASKRNGLAEAWEVIRGWSPRLMIDYYPSSVPVLYMADATSKKIYSHAGTNDDDVAITAIWTGKDDDYDKPDNYKRYRFGYLNAESGSGNIDVDMYASVDYASFAKIGTVNLLGIGSTLGPTGTGTLGPTGTFILGGNGKAEEKFYYTNGGGTPTGKSIRHSIRHAVISEQPTVSTYTSHFKTKPVR